MSALLSVDKYFSHAATACPAGRLWPEALKSRGEGGGPMGQDHAQGTHGRVKKGEPCELCEPLTMTPQVIIDSTLAGNTTADECTWTLSDGVLQVRRCE